MPESIVKVKQFICRFCNHEWFPRYPVAPKICPKCKREGWK